MSVSMKMDAIQMPSDAISQMNMMTCQVRMVRATISSSVRISTVNEMATTCRNSDSNRNNAPYMMIPPAQQCRLINHLHGLFRFPDSTEKIQVYVLSISCILQVILKISNNNNIKKEERNNCLKNIYFYFSELSVWQECSAGL